MIYDKNGMISVCYKDINGNTFKGSFDYIPSNAVVAIINENLLFKDNEGEYKENFREYRIVLGNPVYNIDSIVIFDDVKESKSLDSDPIIVAGKYKDFHYVVFTKKDDKIVSTREEFVDALYSVSGEFLEMLDNLDSKNMVLTNK